MSHSTGHHGVVRRRFALAAAGTVVAADAQPPGNPVATGAADGTVTVFARGADGVLHRRVQDREDGGWSPWADTGGKLEGDPVVAHELNQRLSVFVRRADGHLWRQSQSGDDTWGGWADMGSPPGTTVAGAPVVVADDNVAGTAAPGNDGVVAGNTDGRLELFVRGGDGHLWHRVQKASNGTSWSKWEQLRGTWAGSPAAAVAGDGRITLVGRKPDGTLKVTAQKVPSSFGTPLPDNNWPDWKEIDKGFTGNVALVGNNSDKGTLFQVFGNRGDKLWTLTQTTPGKKAKPAGVWATAKHVKLGPAVQGRPVVAAHPDGRLAVYRVGTDGSVVYRTQSKAADDNSVNGNWPAGWPALDPLKARSVTTIATTREGSASFDVFAVGKGSDNLYQRRRLATGDGAGRRKDVWLEWADLAPIGSDSCAGPGSLDCLTIRNSGLDLALGLESVFRPDSYVTRGMGGALGWQKWALRPTNDAGGAVALYNTFRKKCVDQDGSVVGPFPLRLADCDPSSRQQQWTIEPVMPPGADKLTTTPTDFRLRHGGETDRCLTALDHDVLFYDSKRVYLISCNTDDDNDHNTWKLGNNAGTTSPGVLGVVLKQAAHWCGLVPEATKCTFVPVPDPPTAAYQAAQGCVAGRVLYNPSTDHEVEYYVNWTSSSGTEFTFGGNVGIGGKDGALSLGFNASMTWLQQESTSEQTQIHVPPQHFAWVEIAPVMRETVGYWKIPLGGEWTVPGHNVSYAQNGTNGVDPLIVPKSSKTPPLSGHCG